MILSVKDQSPIWPIERERLNAQGMESARHLIDTRVRELGRTLKDVSLEIGLNETYLQQFVKYGKPKKGLPESARRALAVLLSVSEVDLGGPSASLKIVTPSETPSAFQIDEIDVRGSAGYGGIEPGQRLIDWRDQDDAPSDRPMATGTFYFPEDYARKELGLHPGRADILPIQGDSMDDGSKYALVDGDRVIIDLSSRDIRQGAIFAVWDGDGVIIKQIELIRNSKPPKLLCSSLNPRYKPFELEITDSVHIIGRVAAKLARM
jgi:Peptidase S24-like